MKFFWQIIQTIFEALFPYDSADKKLFSLTKEEAYQTLPKAPPTPFDFIRSIFAYKHAVVKRLIWNIKYKKSAQAVEIGAYALYEYIISNFHIASHSVILIPIPISQRRRNERGYNQCELLLDKIAELDTNKQLLFSKQLMHRKIHRDRQTLKNRSERLVDAKMIFELNDTELAKVRSSSNADFVQNKKIRVIVIDDVVTTGSTLKEAIELLRKAGFKDVSGLSLSH